MSTRTIEEVLKVLEARLAELKPQFQEYLQVQDAIESLRSLDATGQRQAADPATPRGGRQSAAGAAVKGGGPRAQEACELVTAHPGITVAELSQRMGIGTTYLYRVLPALERNGRVVKRGTGYHPAPDASSANATGR